MKNQITTSLLLQADENREKTVTNCMTKRNRAIAIGIAMLLCSAGAVQSLAEGNSAQTLTSTDQRNEVLHSKANNAKIATKVVTSAGVSRNTPAAPSDGAVGRGGKASPGALISRQEFRKKHDKNGNGRLDSSELAAFCSALRDKQKKEAAPGGVPPAKRAN